MISLASSIISDRHSAVGPRLKAPLPGSSTIGRRENLARGLEADEVTSPVRLDDAGVDVAALTRQRLRQAGSFEQRLAVLLDVAAGRDDAHEWLPQAIEHAREGGN